MKYSLVYAPFLLLFLTAADYKITSVFFTATKFVVSTGIISSNQIYNYGSAIYVVVYLIITVIETYLIVIASRRKKLKIKYFSVFLYIIYNYITFVVGFFLDMIGLLHYADTITTLNLIVFGVIILDGFKLINFSNVNKKIKTYIDLSFSLLASLLISLFATLFVIEIDVYFKSILLPLLLLVSFGIYDIFAVFVFPLKQFVAGMQATDEDPRKFMSKYMTVTLIDSRLGLGDILFYSVIMEVSLLLLGFTIYLVPIFLSILAGLFITIFILKSPRFKLKAMPALPIPVFLSLATLFIILLK
jgi:hypothetical protein